MGPAKGAETQPALRIQSWWRHGQHKHGRYAAMIGWLRPSALADFAISSLEIRCSGPAPRPPPRGEDEIDGGSSRGDQALAGLAAWQPALAAWRFMQAAAGDNSIKA